MQLPIFWIQSINGGREIFFIKIFFNRAGQIDQWPEQKSMESFWTKIFFLFRPAESINQFRIISSPQVVGDAGST